MPYKIAGIGVHKRMLHVVVSDVQVDGEYTQVLFVSLTHNLSQMLFQAHTTASTLT
jgi:hypothetical protein